MNTKKYIESTLLELLRTKSIDKIKVNEVIRVVGTCKGTFYKYYRDKYELLIACFRNNFYNELTEKSENWEDFIMNCLCTFEKMSNVIVNAFDSRDVNSVRFYHENLITGYLETELKKHGEHTILDEFAIKVSAVAYTEIMLAWLNGNLIGDKEQILSQMKAAMPNAIYPKIYS